MNSGPIHRIRLQGPWEMLVSSAVDDPHSEFIRIDVPFSVRDVLKETPGRAILRRRFHTPTNLTDSDRVVIRFPRGSCLISDVRVNDHAVPPHGDVSSSFDVTRHLDEFNTLQLTLTCGAATDEHWEGGVLEIHAVDLT